MRLVDNSKLTKEQAEGLRDNNSLIEVTRKVGKAKIMYPYKTPDYEEPINKKNLPKYSNLIVLKKKIKEYFNDCDANGRPYTMSSFALFLGITRSTLVKYELNNTCYEQIIEEAKTKIEAYAEERLFDKNSSGAMFALKNNFANWKEEKETVVKGPLGSILDTINATNQKFIRD